MPCGLLNRIPRNSCCGSTLIETLIYIVLFAIIIGGVMVATYQIIEATDKTQVRVILEDEGNFLLRKIDWALTGAGSVNTPTPNSLIVTKSGGLTLTFDFDSGNLRLRRNTGPAKELNSENVAISNLVFQHITTPGKPDAIKASFTASYYNQSKFFETTKYLRK